MKLPSKLLRSPLREVVFEIRQESDIPLSLLAPSALFGNSLASMTIANLPVSQIPKNIRDQDPNFRYAALVTVKAEAVTVYVGDRSIAFSMTNGYSGWLHYRGIVCEYVDKLVQNQLLRDVSRMALRYINFIDANQSADLSQTLNAEMRLGSEDLLQHQISVESIISRPSGQSSVVRILNPAKIQNISTQESVGCIIDISTAKKVDLMDFTCSFLKNPEEYLDSLHSVSKELFFRSLSENFLKQLGAEYDE